MFKKLLISLLFLSILVPALQAQKLKELKLEKHLATQFATMAMRCIEKEYPNKLSHVMNDAKEVLGPRALHPAFYGCFDWHSSVHGHWMLIRLLKKFPDLPSAGNIRQALGRNLSAANILAEVKYMGQKSRKSFERTYGWAWLLKLAEELYNWDDADGKLWLKNLNPLENEIVKRYLDFFPKQTYAIRTGVHPNTAFGLAFALDYARVAGNKKLEDLIIERSLFYYKWDKNCPVGWEPGGEDFFSPCLMEAALMERVLKGEEFIKWFHVFLPEIKFGKPGSLLKPATVTDRTDGKLVHLDGVNLSRAWCMNRIAAALPETDSAVRFLKEAALRHANAAIANIHSGDYAGEHWLGSFATYLLSGNN
ncbi:MAG: DUF2891 domain-containing protein [bacterium]|nr:DUF2891 domain-containing protein [bacterium]